MINTPEIKLKKEYMRVRKSILISTLLMAGCSLVPLPASAAIERNGRTYWTFEETWELKDAIDADAAAICGYDYGCELDYRFSLLDQPEYRMMGAMMFPSMVYMTAINPKKETIKFFYNGTGDWTIYITDVLGMVVAKTKTVNAESALVDVSGLSSGVYTILINDGRKIHTSKFVKQ